MFRRCLSAIFLLSAAQVPAGHGYAADPDTATATATAPSPETGNRAGPPSAAGSGTDSPAWFGERIAPLLRERCLECHSHAAGKMKGGLTLDGRSGWLTGGNTGPAVMPGQPDASLLMRMVRWTDKDHRMPPREKLPDAETALLEEWIRRGAPGPEAGPPVKAPADGDWWSLSPLASVPLPPARPLTTPGGDDGTHPIDRFIRIRLAREGLNPASPADPHALIRRVHLTLTGLPPSPEDLEESAKNLLPPAGMPGTPAAAGHTADSPTRSPGDSEAAWSALVDRLLASPRFGERQARHWLDTIHFADTHGFEHDVRRAGSWRFRDYVIQAFNADRPWDRLIREQLAADVFYPEETHLTAALGFLGAGPFDASAEGTAQAAFEYVDRDDLVTQTIAAFASTTANCARCHTHKFDPISQEDYFSLQAVFAGVGKGEVHYDDDPAVARRRRDWTALGQAAAAMDAAALLQPARQALVAEWEKAGGGREVWQTLIPETYTSAFGCTIARQPDGSLLSSGPQPETDVTTVTLKSPLTEISALRLDLLADDSLPFKGPGRAGNGNVHISEIEILQFAGEGSPAPEKLAIARTVADYDQEGGYSGFTVADGDNKSSWAVHPRVGQDHHVILKLARPAILSPDARLTVVIRQLQPGHLLGRFRLSATAAPAAPLAALPAPAVEALRAQAPERSPEARLALAAAVLKERAWLELAALPPQAHVYAASAAAQAARGALMKAPQPRLIHVLRRGDLDKPGALAGPGALSAVQALPSRFSLPDPAHEGARRAALADWLAHPDNPLVWRSVVNRVWQWHFGKGLSATPSDFGRMGDPPSHPELLDWLAHWFRDEARGSLKALHRLILTSHTWRQTASPPAAALAAGRAHDPDNRLLWRMDRTRLDADSFRDAVMAASGRLDLTMGGPAIAHYNASPGPQATPVLDYAGFDWDSPGATRRSIYRVVYRGIADPFMEMLDFPDMGLLSPTRGFSASALQSLTLFNNAFLLGQSAHLATRASAETATSAPPPATASPSAANPAVLTTQPVSSPPPLPAAPPPGEPAAAAVTRVFQLVLLRNPSPSELEECTALASTAGLPAVARVLFNTNEFLFVE